ncbi:MAG: DUF3187 family protein [Nitrospinae bacterium]|nr:DUF3187 family protein [Nitrospinota bacterium]
MMAARSKGLTWVRCWCWILWLVHALLSGTASAGAAQQAAPVVPEHPNPIVGGPFPIRSLSPIQLLFFQFIPERAVPIPRGAWNARVDVVDANILARGRRQDDFFRFDFELTRANLALQYGVFDRLGLELEIPVIYTWKGFLDDFIKGFERTTGFKRTIRFDRPQHLFAHVLEKNGDVVLQGQSGAVGLGDIAVSTKALLREEGPWAPAIAGRFALKLPTGDEDRALGSGELDVGLGLALEKTLGPARVYFNGGLTVPTGDPFARAGIDTAPMFSGFLTGEYRISERFSLLVQLNGVSSPLRHTGLDISKATFEILAGLSWVIPGTSLVWQAGLMQDLDNSDRTADFALFTSWSLFFGHPAFRPPSCCKEQAP